MSPIKFFYFDLGRVVVDNEASVANLASFLGVPASAIEVFFQQHGEKACKGHLSSKEYLALFERVLGVRSGAQDFAQLWGKFLVPITETHQLIKELSRKISLGVISDIEPGVFQETVRHGGIPDIPWAVVVESHRLGYLKPDRHVYEYAQKKSGVLPEDIFYTDDKPTYVEVAKTLGWRGTVFSKDDIAGSIKKIRRMLQL